MEDKHHQNSQPNNSDSLFSYPNHYGNLGLVAICSATFGTFITLALVIKLVPQKTSHRHLSKNTPIIKIIDTTNFQDQSNPAQKIISSSQNLPSKPVIRKQAAIGQPISQPSVAPSTATSVAPSVATSTNPSAATSVMPIPPTPLNQGGFNSTSANPSVATSTNPSVATSANPPVAPSVAPSVATSVATSSNPSSNPSAAPSAAPSANPSVATSVATSVAPSVAPSVATSTNPSAATSVMPIPPTPLNQGGFNSTSANPSPAPSVATNQQLFPILKTALNFTSKHWLTNTTTVTQIKQENKPNNRGKPSEERLSEPTDSQILELTTEDAIILSLQNNRDIKNAYLQRILDRQDLEVAEDKFVPNFTPTVAVVYNRNQLGSSTANRGDLNLGADLIVRIPTGATIEANWRGARLTQNTLESSSVADQNSLRQDVSVNFTQPLLRGFGVDVNRASIEIARLNEKSNILGLKSTLISNITSTLRAYRNLLEAQEALTIQQISLESAQRQLEYTEALIEAGRRARIELVNLQADAANRQLSLLASQNRLDQARLNLIAVLDIDQTIQVVATDKPSNEDLELISFNQQVAKEIAFENNIDYLRSLINIERANIDLFLAKNDKNWDLDFTAGYTNNLNNTAENNNDFRAGISLSREFGDRHFEQQVERSQIQLEIAQNTLQEQQENLEIEVINAFRDVEFSLQQVEQAKQARELSEQQLENEREKLRLGVGNSRLIDVLRFEEDLVSAKNAELNAQIGYLNSLTSLYATLGITLDRWEITVETETHSQETQETYTQEENNP